MDREEELDGEVLGVRILCEYIRRDEQISTFFFGVEIALAYGGVPWMHFLELSILEKRIWHFWDCIGVWELDGCYGIRCIMNQSAILSNMSLTAS